MEMTRISSDMYDLQRNIPFNAWYVMRCYLPWGIIGALKEFMSLSDGMLHFFCSVNKKCTVNKKK